MSVTSNVFYWRSMPWHCSSSPAVQTEEQCVTTWHLCSCDIIKMLIWQPTNYESRREDILHSRSCWHDLFTEIVRFSHRHPPCATLCFFYSKLHPLHPKVNPIRWMFCHGSDFFFVPRSCYLLAADKPMNSGAKWNSYCYQKHKIPITLDVRAETRKWNRYS